MFLGVPLLMLSFLDLFYVIFVNFCSLFVIFRGYFVFFVSFLCLVFVFLVIFGVFFLLILSFLCLFKIISVCFFFFVFFFVIFLVSHRISDGIGVVTWKTGLDKVHDGSHVRNGTHRVVDVDGIAGFRAAGSVAYGAAATGIGVRQRRMGRHLRRLLLLLRLLLMTDSVQQRGAHFGDQRVALAELVLQVLSRSQTLELAVDHDGDPGAQSFTFLHTKNQSNPLVQ